MTDRAELPSIDDLPIPADVRPDKSWTGQMLEMASHIGPLATLKVIEHRGGERVYISGNPDASPFADVLDSNQAATIARVYAGNELQVPVARTALRRARRAGLIAAARARTLSVADLAKILQTSRTYASQLVNNSDEATGATAIVAMPRRRDPRQIDMFPDAAE